MVERILAHQAVDLVGGQPGSDLPADEVDQFGVKPPCRANTVALAGAKANMFGAFAKVHGKFCESGCQTE